MAAVAPTADQATDLLQNLSLESQTKSHNVPDANKKQSKPVDTKEVASMLIPSHDRSTTPLPHDFMDPSMCYFPNGYAPQAYYYGGSINDWEDCSRYVNPDGLEMSPHGVYGDMYHNGFGYAPYGAYPPGSPVPTMGPDGQLYGPQQYQYPGSYYQQPTPTSSVYTPTNPPSSEAEVSKSVATNQPPVPVDATKTNGSETVSSNEKGSNGSLPGKSNLHNSTLTSNGTYDQGVLLGGFHSSGYQDVRLSGGGVRSPVSWLDAPAFADGHYRLPPSSTVSSAVSHAGNYSSARNHNQRPQHPMGLHSPRPAAGMGPAAPGFMNRFYPNNRFYGPGGNTLRTGMGFGLNGYDSRISGRGWMTMDGKYKPKGRGNGGFYSYGNDNMEDLNELNRGPRSGRFKNTQKAVVPNVTIAVKGQNLPSDANSEDSVGVPNRDQYNLADFPEQYSDARFFVIKSYSEDDVHKCIKYSVWASTPNGNKKLDVGYQEAQEKAGGCPVFLFFSVNTSGQFVGVAEMAGPVDFNKTVDYWQQDKWNGCFAVKWHIVKDVPNSLLKHITLENNENKPVTNSRDTQEVKLEQGLQMLKLFKDHVSKTSILDDFAFYETRQKTMQERRVKQQFQKQVWDGKAVPTVEGKENDGSTVKPVLQELSSVYKEIGQAGRGEQKKTDNGMTAIGGDAHMLGKSLTEKRVGANGLANGVTNGLANGI